ncbi:MAG TPA: mercuric transporter MerT family protein [Gemmatimonadaceae bacterium]|nr:mercuric transporter MerT family protein [Gemmatimonadaceae bacterium]
MRSASVASAGGVVAALLGSLCCIGPLVFVAFGLGAGLATTFEPLRPIFGLLMVAMFGVGFYAAYGKRTPSPESSDGGGTTGATCVVPEDRTRDRVILWSATVLAVVLWTSPTWVGLFV